MAGSVRPAYPWHLESSQLFWALGGHVRSHLGSARSSSEKKSQRDPKWGITYQWAYLLALWFRSGAEGGDAWGSLSENPGFVLGSVYTTCGPVGASQGVQLVKNPLPGQEMQKAQVRSQGWEDPMRKEMATHSSITA